jgi:hypothetical protein
MRWREAPTSGRTLLVLASKLTLAAASAALAFAFAAPAAKAADVCNEAENSFQGGYTVGDRVDPNPPAFLRGSQMRVGEGHGAGLVNAAERSPALQVCSPVDANPGGDTGDGGPQAG